MGNRNVKRIPWKEINEENDECERHIDTIKEQVGRGFNRRQQPMHIFVIGAQGSGKSSFVASLAAAFSREKWKPCSDLTSKRFSDAKKRGVRSPPERYEKCCNADKEEYKKFRLIPTIVKVPSKENIEDHLNMIPNQIEIYNKETTIRPATASFRESFRSSARSKKQNLMANLGIVRVIFVASATAEVPMDLLKCVEEICRMKDIPMFLVMTKLDKYGKEMCEEVYKTRKKTLLDGLKLIESESCFIALTNYCDDVDPEEERLQRLLPDIDAPILKFMTKGLMKRYPEVWIIGFYYEKIKKQKTLIESILKSKKVQNVLLSSMVIEGQDQLGQIPPGKLYVVFVDYNQRDCILENENMIGKLRLDTVNTIINRKGSLMLVYMGDRGSSNLTQRELYNKNLLSVESHPVLKKINGERRFLSIYEVFTSDQQKRIGRVASESLEKIQIRIQ